MNNDLYGYEAWRMEIHFGGRWKSHKALCSQCYRGEHCIQGSSLNHAWRVWSRKAQEQSSQKRVE